jgi:hypothetical protein
MPFLPPSHPWKRKTILQTLEIQNVDLGSLYPSTLKPAFITSIREFYITTYADRFFSSPPAWFNMYVWVELIYHLPLSIWAIGALIRGAFSKIHTS